ncbi:MAG: M24 family metallopeptidase [Endomicrobiia bacterium]
MQLSNIKKIREKFKEYKIESFIVNNPSDLFYLTGCNFSDYWFVITENESIAFSSKMLYSQIKDNLNTKIVLFDSFDDFSSKLEKFLKKRKIKNLGVDSSSIFLEIFQKIKKRVKNINWKFIPEFVKKIREIKTENEVELIREACKISVRVLSMIRKYLKPGVREKWISDMICSLFYKLGAEPAFIPIVASGPNSAYPHHVSSDRSIKENDIVLIDLGCKFNGYCSDLTRTFFLGKIKKLYKKIFYLVEKAQKSAFREIYPGRKVSQLDISVREIIKSAGFGKYFLHRTGHGIGIEVHELPIVVKNSNVVLKKGMVFTIEPGIYIQNFGGVRIEDTVLVTDTGYEILTGSPL